MFLLKVPTSRNTTVIDPFSLRSSRRGGPVPPRFAVNRFDFDPQLHKDRGIKEGDVPRPRKQDSSTSPLTSGQASYVLERLIAERRVSQGEVSRYLNEMHREISSLEQRLNALRAAAGAAPRPATASTGSAARSAKPAAEPRRGPGRPAKRQRSAITPQQLASRQLQGRYLGLIRQIPASRRAQFQKTAKDRGREAAIKELLVALKK